MDPIASPTAPPRRPSVRGRWLAGLAIVAAAAGVGTWAARHRWSPGSQRAAEERLAAGDYAAAAEEAGAVLAEAPENARARLVLGLARLGAKDPEGCVRALEPIPDWSSLKAEALFYQGKALRDLKRGRASERACRACRARGRPGSPAVLRAGLELLSLYAMEERRDDFLGVFWTTLEQLADEDRMMVLAMRMRLEFEQTRPEINEEALRAYLKADPRDAYARAGLAAARAHANDLPAARAEYARAVSEEPGDPELRERYLDILHRQGDFPALERALAERPAGSDDRPATLKFLGLVAQRAGRLDEAIAAFARAVAADPSDPEAHHRLSQALYRTGRAAEAARHAAENTRLREARDRLQKAWTRFANAYEAAPEKVAPGLVLGMARACDAAGLGREAAAWQREAERRAPTPDAATGKAGSGPRS